MLEMWQKMGIGGMDTFARHYIIHSYAWHLFFTVLAEMGPSVQENHNELLIPTALDSLSPQHSAVYLFGCHVMQLLSESPMFPSVLLLLAKSVPFCSWPSNENQLAHFTGDFYFDPTNQILYLSEAKLQHVGHFIAVILQSMAHIAVGNRKSKKRVQNVILIIIA